MERLKYYVTLRAIRDWVVLQHIKEGAKSDNSSTFFQKHNHKIFLIKL